MRRRLAVITLLILLFASSNAAADIYKYRNENGDIVLTTEPRNDLELIEVIKDQRAKTKATKRKHRSTSDGGSKRKSSASSPKPRTSTEVSADQTVYDDLIAEASEAYSIPFAFIKAVVKIESNYNRYAVSNVGAMGLMQLMPATAEDMGVSDPFDPRENIFGGTKYLRMMANKYNGDINLVLSAYNAGPGNVDKFSGIPFESTRGYVQKVYRWYQRYQEQYGSD